MRTGARENARGMRMSKTQGGSLTLLMVNTIRNEQSAFLKHSFFDLEKLQHHENV